VLENGIQKDEPALKALSCWRGRGEEKLNNSLLQNPFVNQNIMNCIPLQICSSPKPSPSGEGLRAKINT